MIKHVPPSFRLAFRCGCLIFFAAAETYEWCQFHRLKEWKYSNYHDDEDNGYQFQPHCRVFVVCTYRCFALTETFFAGLMQSCTSQRIPRTAVMWQSVHRVCYYAHWEATSKFLMRIVLPVRVVGDEPRGTSAPPLCSSLLRCVLMCSQTMFWGLREHHQFCFASSTQKAVEPLHRCWIVSDRKTFHWRLLAKKCNHRTTRSCVVLDLSLSPK